MTEEREIVVRNLLDLAADVGDHREMAILGEGNISGKLDDRYFLVKASGTSLGALRPEHLVEVDAEPLLDAVENANGLGDEDVERLLLDARVDKESLKPSVESLFHAWLLNLPGINYVGHTHAIAVNQILCSRQAEAFAKQRLFPDHIVYCGSESVLIPYVDPGLTLARTIAAEVEKFHERLGVLPKTILMQNHGLIAIGERHTEVIAALAMAEKAARVFAGTFALGGPVFLDERQVQRIGGRIDEHYRQRMLRESANRR
jgi:rhamnose utilization protein RhaD (predicted bifunctional aldolase and dehydrogenase)